MLWWWNRYLTTALPVYQDFVFPTIQTHKNGGNICILGYQKSAVNQLVLKLF